MSASVSAPAPSLPAGRAQLRRRDIAFLPLHVALTTLVIAMSLGSIALSVYEFPESHAPIAIVTGVVGAGLIAYARYFLRLPWISAPVVYLILFWVFHFGMTFTAVLVPSVLTKMADEELEWLSLPSARMSMILGVLGAASFAFAIGCFGRGSAATPLQRQLRTESEPALYRMGWLLLLSGLALLIVVFAQNGGPALFSLNVLEFRNLTMLPTALELAQLGCLLALCGAGARRWPRPLVLWSICIAGPMLLAGLRSTAMVPLVTIGVVLAHRGVRIRRGLIAAVVLGCLLAIPAIGAFRLVGFANRELVSWTEVTPLDTFMELGGSLQATRAYVDWIAQGDEFLLGASYWAPIDRQVLVRVIPGREPIPYDQDERVPSRLTGERDGAIGGSATGEAYYNFGVFGPLIYYAFVGVVFGLLQRSTGSAYGSAMVGVTILPLYFNIRSDWLPVPAQIGEGIAVIGLCYFLGRIAFTRALARPARPAVSSNLTPVGR